jgi:hypothetical protein
MQCRPVVERRKSGIFFFFGELRRQRRLLVPPLFLPFLPSPLFPPLSCGVGCLRCHQCSGLGVERLGWRRGSAFIADLGYGGRMVDAAVKTRGGNQGCCGRVLGRGAITMASWRARFTPRLAWHHTVASRVVGVASHGGIARRVMGRARARLTEGARLRSWHSAFARKAVAGTGGIFPMPIS